MRFVRSVHLAGTILVAATVAGCGVAGCGREQAQTPPAQAQVETTRPGNQPTTVTGCLRAGDADATFVLTTAQSVDGTPTATYHLTGAPGVNLQELVGNRVEVSGVVNGQSQIATRQSSQPAANATGTAGTAGTPTVQTGTELSITRLDVTTVQRAGGECKL
ncbi:MAG: hypothetical protein H0W08_21410 [Acidobacteria bacterium]|nr:hypothetical protein [Acidobacteriota bacterium]